MMRTQLVSMCWVFVLRALIFHKFWFDVSAVLINVSGKKSGEMLALKTSDLAHIQDGYNFSKYHFHTLIFVKGGFLQRLP